MERILKSSVEIPDSVEQKINDTYRDLGLADKSGSRTVRKRKRKAWVTIAAAAALVAGLGVTVYAGRRSGSHGLRGRTVFQCTAHAGGR